MISLKTRGDDIASEFLRLTGNNQRIKKEANIVGVEPSEVKVGGKSIKGAGFEKALEQKMSEVKDLASEAMDEAGLPSRDGESDEVDPAEFLIDRASDDGVGVPSALDSSIESFSGRKVLNRKRSIRYANAKEVTLLKGLDKIASKLKAKGEVFASDMVTATSQAIVSDIKKEAGKRMGVESALDKIASELRSSGDAFAADVVRTAMINISGS
jgi:hypothetical protein